MKKLLKELKNIILLPFMLITKLCKALKTHQELIIAVVLGNLLCFAILAIFAGGVQLCYIIATKLLGM